MNKKWILTLAAVSVIALCVTAVGGWYSAKAENGTKDIQYVLYLGTNDKDTNLPVFTPEEAKAKVREILIRHFGGYTLQ